MRTVFQLSVAHHFHNVAIEVLTAILCKYIIIHVHCEDVVSVAHHFHNVVIEAVVGGKGHNATDDCKDAQETETVHPAQPHHPPLALALALPPLALWQPCPPLALWQG